MTFDAHTLLFATLAVLCDFQSVFFGIFPHDLAISEGILPDEPYLKALLRHLRPEKALSVGGFTMTLGLILLSLAIVQWRRVDYGPLNYSHTMRFVLPGAALTALGFSNYDQQLFP